MWGPEDRCAFRRLRKHWASLQAAPVLSKICVSRTCFLKITSSHCQFACYGPNKKAYDRLEKYLLGISSKMNLWSKFLQFPANSMNCSCSVLPQSFALLCLSHISTHGQVLAAPLFSLLFAPLWPGWGAGYWPDGLGCLLPGDSVVLLQSPDPNQPPLPDQAHSRPRKEHEDMLRRRLVVFGSTLTSPKALGWVHPRLQFSLSAAVPPKLHSEGDKTCVHMSAGRKQRCFQGISVTPSCQR